MEMIGGKFVWIAAFIVTGVILQVAIQVWGTIGDSVINSSAVTNTPSISSANATSYTVGYPPANAIHNSGSFWQN